MITLHKTEIARQNKTLSIFFETPQNFTNHFFRGAHVLLREPSSPSSPIVRTLPVTLQHMKVTYHTYHIHRVRRDD